jgi:ferritin
MAILSKNTIDRLNSRIQGEEISIRLYKSMAICLEYQGYLGAAKLWNKYSEEEREHVEIVNKYLLDLDIEPQVMELPKPKHSTDFIGILKDSYNHEIDVTNDWSQVAKGALQEGDMMTLHLAQQFLDEQRDEIAKTKGWLDRLEAFGTSKEALRFLDNEMGQV